MVCITIFQVAAIKIENTGREDRDGETHVNPWLIRVNVWQKPL